MMRMTSRFALAVAVLGLVAGAASRAGAAIVTFTDRALFLAAAGPGLTSEDFQGLGGNTYQTLNSSIEPSIPAGVTFSSIFGTADDLFVAPAGFAGNPAIVTDSLFASFFGTPLIADFSPLVTAVGSDLIAFDFAGGTATITVSVREPGGATSSYNVTPPVGSATFFGVIATGGTTIDRLAYAPPARFTAGVDNFLFGQVTAVPEASTVAMAGVVALAGLGYGWRRKRAAA